MTQESNTFIQSAGTVVTPKPLIIPKILPQKAETYIDALLEAKAKIQENFMDMAKTLADAKSELSTKEFQQLIKDKRINLKETQVNKLISIYEVYCNAVPQSTEILTSKGVEKAYLLSSISDTGKRTETEQMLATKHITVTKLRTIVDKINTNNLSPEEAERQVDMETETEKKQPKSVISAEEHEALKQENERLLAENEELKRQLEQYTNGNIQ